VKLSILVKTFNEEAHIERCLKSVFKAVRDIDGGIEVIVADSLSTDTTVEIARRLGAKVVQLCSPADRGCGAGVQLGFQYANGDYVYFLDGDMELHDGFLSEAIKALDSDGGLAGVGGLLEDRSSNNFFDRRRIQAKQPRAPKLVEWLDGGGLYRRAAITGAGGYAGNRNLIAYEEAELGLRLRSHGWRLVRLAVLAIFHTGHAEATFPLMLKIWRSGRLEAGGVFLKSALGKPWFFRVLRMFFLPVAALLYWTVWLTSLKYAESRPILTWLAAVSGSAYLVLAFRKRSLTDAALSLLIWHVHLIGIVRGLVARKSHSPFAEIPSIVVAEGKTRCHLPIG
jgi:glycosyltransferase involved in cell wall biosynthesis